MAVGDKKATPPDGKKILVVPAPEGMNPNIPATGDETPAQRNLSAVTPTLDYTIASAQDEGNTGHSVRVSAPAMQAVQGAGDERDLVSQTVLPSLSHNIPATQDEGHTSNVAGVSLPSLSAAISSAQDEGKQGGVVQVVAPALNDAVRAAQDEPAGVLRAIDATLKADIPATQDEGSGRREMATLIPSLPADIRATQDEEYLKKIIPLDGKLILTEDPATIGKNFQTLSNMRYKDTRPATIGGQTRITTSRPYTLQDVSAYTEVDAGADTVAKTSSTVLTAANMTREEDSYIYKDFGASFFCGNFEHKLTLKRSAKGGDTQSGVWMLSNTVGDYYTQTDNLSVYITNTSIVLAEMLSSTPTTDAYASFATGTDYYLKIVRNEDVGNYGTLYCYIYSDTAYTTLVDTLSVALGSKANFRYLYGLASYKDSTAGSTDSFTVTNLRIVYPWVRNIFQFSKDNPSESHILIQAGNKYADTYVFDNTTAVPTAGDFTNTPLWTDSSGAGLGRFSPAPGGHVAYCNGVDTCLWGGDESDIGAFLTSTGTLATTSTILNDAVDYTEAALNTLETEGNIIILGGGVGSTCKTMLHCDELPTSSTILDAAGTPKTWTLRGNATVTTAWSKFGPGSLDLDGTADYADTPDHADFNMGTGTFTIDFYWRPRTITGDQCFFSHSTGANDYMRFYWAQATNTLTFEIKTTAGGVIVSVTKALTPVAGTSYHLAVVRGWGGNANDWVVCVNGTPGSTVTDTDGFADYSSLFTVGAFFVTPATYSQYVDGQIDEFRVLKAEAFWTAAFTPLPVAYIKDARQFVIGVPRRASGFKFTVNTANTATTSTLTGKEWQGGGWSALTLTDATVAASSSMETTGWVTFSSTVATSKPVYIKGRYLYFYLFNLDAGTAILSHVSCEAPFQLLTDVWDGVERQIQSCMVYNAATSRYQDYTLKARDADYTYSITSTWGGLGATHIGTLGYIDVGFTEPMIGLITKFADGYTNAGGACAITVKRFTGQGFVSVGTVNDGSSLSGVSFAQNGQITWAQTNYGVESTTALESGPPLYYYRLYFSAAFSNDVYIDQILGIPAQRHIGGYAFPLYADDRLILCNNTDYKRNAMLASAPKSCQVFNGEEIIEDEFGDATALTGGASVFSQFGASLYTLIMFWKNKKTYASIVDTEGKFHKYTVSEEIGCNAPLTIQTVELPPDSSPGLNRNLAIWASSDGVFISDGKSPMPVHKDIRPIFDTRNATYYLTKELADSFSSFVDRGNAEYHLCLSIGDSSTSYYLNTEYALDLVRWKWWAAARGTDNYLQCGSTVVDTYGTKYVYGVANTGQVCRLEYGNTFDGTAIISTVRIGDAPLLDDLYTDTQVALVEILHVAKTVTAASMTYSHYIDTSTTTDTTVSISPASAGYRDGIKIALLNSTPAILHSGSLTITTDDEITGLEPITITYYFRKARERLVPGYVATATGGGAGSVSADSDLFNFTTQNSVNRLTHSFHNFLSNAGFESWLGGVAAVPDTWNIFGATAAQSSTAAQGSYSAEITFSAAGQAFYNSFGNFGRYGVYTYTCYYQKVSGAGGAYLTCQEGEDDYTELSTYTLDGTIDGQWKLASLTTTIPMAHWGKASRFGFNPYEIGGDANSVWLFDECMCQEGYGLASTWVPATIWDSGAGQYLLQSLYAGYWNLFGYSPGTAPTAFIDIYGQPGLRIRNSTPPVAANSTGAKGQIEWDDTYIYVCVATDTWITYKKDGSFKP